MISPLDLLPVHAEGRIGEHVVELVGVELVVAERVAELDAAHVLALDEHVALADGVALGVEFLAEGAHDGLGVQLVDVLHAAGEEAAGARRGVVDGADDALFGEGVVVFHEDQGGRQPHDVARGEVLAGRLVGAFRKAPDQLLEDEAHVVVADGLGAEVRGGHLLHDLEEQVGLVELADELAELEVLEDLAGVLREAVHVGEQVALDVGAAQLGEVHRRGVVEGLACRLEQELLAGVLLQVLHGLELLHLLEDLGLVCLQHALQAAQDRERQDHAAILGLLEVASEQVGEGPDVGGQVVRRLRGGW